MALTGSISQGVDKQERRTELKADDDRTPQTDCEGRIFLGGCPDGWLAERLVQKCDGRVRCVDHTRTFLEWDGNSWRDDIVSTVPLPLFARMRGLGRRWGQILEEARSDARVAVSLDKLDQDPDLLGTPAGVIDLRTGELLRPDPTMYVTRTTAVAS